MAGRSGAFESFYESYFGDPYMAWHDGLDTQSLLSLQGEEREEAERLLTEALNNGSSDYRPAAGLATLGPKSVAAKLKEMLPQTTGSQCVEVARALWNIEKYPPAAATLIDLLKHFQFWGVRLDAARVLADVKTPGSVDALRQALHDPEDLVRHHAAVSLLSMHGIYDNPAESHPLTIQIMSKDDSEQQAAIAALQKLVQKQGKIEMEA
ncbi:MAG: HEAT repeat domain-containing protein [Chloroflexota bacterium]